MSRLRMLGCASALGFALLSGCMRPAPTLELERDAFESVLDDAQWGEAVRRARTKLYERLGRRRLATGVRRELLPPIGHDAAGIALSHWLLRLEGTLAPSMPASPVTSVASAQLLLRERRDAPLELWMIDIITPTPALRFEIVVVRTEGTVRSGEVSISHAAPLNLWPFEATSALASGRLPSASELISVQGKSYAIGHGGPLELRLDGRRILGTPSSLEPYRLASREPLPALERADVDVRLRFRAVIDSSGETSRRFELRRGMHAWHLDFASGDESSLRALAAWASKDPYDWVVLRDDGRVEIHRRALRVVPPPRATEALDQRPVVRVARVTADSARDPLRVWADAAQREPIPLEHGAELHSRRLDIRVGCRLAAKRWEQSVRERCSKTSPDHDWLLDPLRGIRIEARGEDLRLEADELPPDIVQRLAHPALWPAHSPPSDCFYLQPKPRLIWVDTPAEADAWWGWPARVGEGTAPDDDAVSVAIVPSAAADASATARLAAVLAPVDLPELFAIDAAAWSKRMPATRRPWPANDALTPAPARGEWTLVLFVDDSILDPTERRRLLDRLRVLLPPAGFRLETHRLGETEVSIPSRAIVASLLRIGLFTEDPFLRALELRSWTTVDALEAHWAQLQLLSPDDDERRRAAERLEEDLLRNGRVIPLWRERWQLRLDPRLEQLEEPTGCLPASLGSLRWHPAAVGLFP